MKMSPCELVKNVPLNRRRKAEPSQKPLRLFPCVFRKVQRRYSNVMKTLSPTAARQNLTKWLDQAIQGKAVGITHKGHVIKLQPVPVIEDWAAEEYDLDGDELDRISAKLLRSGEEAIRKGQARPIKDLLAKHGR